MHPYYGVGRNLDLGNTIWLNTSRKLLGMSEWFFTPWSKKPRRVREEFRHHSHTHPDVAPATSSATAHNCTSVTGYSTCTYAGADSHAHGTMFIVADSHTHTPTLSFAAANLGTPWNNHTHTISASVSNAGASHNHSLTSPTAINVCAACELSTPHSHSQSGASTTDTVAYSHSHGVTGKSTATAAGVCQTHTHTYSFNSDDAGAHNHVHAAAIATNRCAKTAVVHDHTDPPNPASPTHKHAYSGTTLASTNLTECPSGQVIFTLINEYDY